MKMMIMAILLKVYYYIGFCQYGCMRDCSYAVAMCYLNSLYIKDAAYAAVDLQCRSLYLDLRKRSKIHASWWIAECGPD